MKVVWMSRKKSKKYRAVGGMIIETKQGVRCYITTIDKIKLSKNRLWKLNIITCYLNNKKILVLKNIRDEKVILTRDIDMSVYIGEEREAEVWNYKL